MFNARSFLTFFAVVLLNSLTAYSKDFGVHGALFPIQENNLLTVIREKLTLLHLDGSLEELNHEIAQKVSQKAQEPSPVPGLQTVHQNNSRLFDPSIRLSSDIRDHKGAPIARKGQVINPLDYVSLRHPLLFFDGRDPQQIQWARRQNHHAQWILVAGKPIGLEEQEKKPVYFDQGGILSRRFKLTHVPCRITQKMKALLIEEIRPSPGED